MTSRLRKPYTTSSNDDESDDNDLPLDEQEQEELIEELQKENDRKNAFFILAFTCLCAIPALILTARIFSGNGNGMDVLAISSLAMTGFTVRCIPLNPLAPEYLSPLEAWVPILNPILIAAITVGAVFTNRHTAHDYYLYLPLFVWGAVVVGRNAMASVNLGDLEKLKYKYKGA